MTITIWKIIGMAFLTPFIFAAALIVLWMVEETVYAFYTTVSAIIRHWSTKNIKPKPWQTWVDGDKEICILGVDPRGTINALTNHDVYWITKEQWQDKINNTDIYLK